MVVKPKRNLIRIWYDADGRTGNPLNFSPRSRNVWNAAWLSPLVRLVPGAGIRCSSVLLPEAPSFLTSPLLTPASASSGTPHSGEGTVWHPLSCHISCSFIYSPAAAAWHGGGGRGGGDRSHQHQRDDHGVDQWEHGIWSRDRSAHLWLVVRCGPSCPASTPPTSAMAPRLPRPPRPCCPPTSPIPASSCSGIELSTGVREISKCPEKAPTRAINHRIV